MNLFIPSPDGASAASIAVLAYVRENDGIECSWNANLGLYEAEPSVARWYNRRHQGYVISLKHPEFGQLNIAFYEYKSSDDIQLFVFRKETPYGDPPTYKEMEDEMEDEANFKMFDCYSAYEAASKIKSLMEEFWSTGEYSLWPGRKFAR